LIHIGTLHYRDDRWIDIQLRYLKRHTREPYRVYASFDGIGERHRARFDQVLEHGDVETEERPGVRIALKLNLLTEEMVRQADRDDLLVFMHGDAFPIAEWVDPVRTMIAESSLAAVQSIEDLAPIPHWSFCATTAGLWTRIGGTWSRSRTGSTDVRGNEIYDTGVELADRLDHHGIAWYPIPRTNGVDLHPVFFGIYGDIVYHHGAGFRTSMSQVDPTDYFDLPIPLRNLAGVRRRIANTRLSQKLYRRIREDDDFHRLLREGKAISG
jgi:hypothetical protein